MARQEQSLGAATPVWRAAFYVLGILGVLGLGCTSDLKRVVEGLACTGDGRCLPGYACDSATNQCVREAPSRQDSARRDGGALPHVGDADSSAQAVSPSGHNGVVEPRADASVDDGSTPDSGALPEPPDATSPQPTAGGAPPQGQCPTQQTLCGGTCVDLQTNLDHCGACDRLCEGGQDEVAMCTSGTCMVSCRNGLTLCDNRCVNTQNDKKNCGICGLKCSGSQRCVGGSCQ